MAPRRYYSKKKRSKKETYEQRNILLRELGFRTYSVYLNSRIWYAIRNSAYRIHGRTCRLCPRRAITIHHLSYTRAVLLGQDLSLLTPLCRYCHDQVEFSADGRKRTLASSQRHYYKLLSARISHLKRISQLNSTHTL